jgi:hypothetical protein
MADDCEMAVKRVHCRQRALPPPCKRSRLRCRHQGLGGGHAARPREQRVVRALPRAAGAAGTLQACPCMCAGRHSNCRRAACELGACWGAWNRDGIAAPRARMCLASAGPQRMGSARRERQALSEHLLARLSAGACARRTSSCPTRRTRASACGTCPSAPARRPSAASTTASGSWPRTRRSTCSRPGTTGAAPAAPLHAAAASSAAPPAAFGTRLF